MTALRALLPRRAAPGEQEMLPANSEEIKHVSGLSHTLYVRTENWLDLHFLFVALDPLFFYISR